jgi:predicted nucleic acid-binding protein
VFLIDTNVLVYQMTDSPYRESCASIVAAAAERRADGCISTAILEEVWYLELTRRIEGLEGATSDIYEIFSPLLSINDDVFRRALALEVAELGSNDRIHAATCQEWGIKSIVSADVAFDGIRWLRRVDPLDERAVERLLRAGR